MNWQQTLYSNATRMRWLQPGEYVQMRETLNYCVAKLGPAELAKQLKVTTKCVEDWLRRENRPTRKSYVCLQGIAEQLKSREMASG